MMEEEEDEEEEGKKGRREMGLGGRSGQGTMC